MGHLVGLLQPEMPAEKLAKTRGADTTVRAAVTVILVPAKSRQANALPPAHTYKGCTKSQRLLSYVRRAGVVGCSSTTMRAALMCRVGGAMRPAAAVRRMVGMAVIVPANTVWVGQHPVSVQLPAHACKECSKCQLRRSCQWDAPFCHRRLLADGLEVFLPLFLQVRIPNPPRIVA